jgi:hypothetical protein
MIKKGKNIYDKIWRYRIKPLFTLCEYPSKQF